MSRCLHITREWITVDVDQFEVRTWRCTACKVAFVPLDDVRQLVADVRSDIDWAREPPEVPC